MSKKKKQTSQKNICIDIEETILGENINSKFDIENNDITTQNFEKNYEFQEKFKLYEEIIKGNEDLIKAKDVIIQELNEKVVLLQEKIIFLSVNTVEKCPETKTYSNAIQQGNQIMQVHTDYHKINVFNDTALTIKPSNNQDSKITRKELGKHINPATLKIGIKKIENLRDGGVKIHCESKEDISKLQNEAKSKLGSNYLVQMQEKRKPRIKVVGIEDSMNEEELKESILTKNDFLINAKLKIVTIRKMKTKFMAILEIDIKNFKIVMDKGYLFIDFSVCSVFEHVDVLRCFKCTGYHHTAKTCTKKQNCLKCGKSDHTASECPTNIENISCPNCSEENEKHNTGYFVNHSPFDINCQIYKINVEKAKRNICYNLD